MGNKKNGKSNETEYTEVDADEFYEIVDRMKSIVESFDIGDVGSSYDEWVRRGCFDRALEVCGAAPGTSLKIENVVEIATKIYGFVRGRDALVTLEQERPERLNLSGDASALYARTP